VGGASREPKPINIPCQPPVYCRTGCLYAGSDSQKREPVDVCWYRRRGLVCRGCFQGEEEIKSNVIYRYRGSVINSLCFNFPSIHLKYIPSRYRVPVLVRCSCGVPVPVLESFYRYRYSYVSCSMNRIPSSLRVNLWPFCTGKGNLRNRSPMHSQICWSHFGEIIFANLKHAIGVVRPEGNKVISQVVSRLAKNGFISTTSDPVGLLAASCLRRGRWARGPVQKTLFRPCLESP
jgi:hypothetical protein